MSIGTFLYTLLISPLQLLFEVVFSLANKLTNHPGLSIIVLSLAINFLVLPLYKRSDAMQEEERDMQAKLQKGVAHIKKVFKGDERMMILQTYYRQNNYKPTYVLRGATSLLLEIPFFMAAYNFLSNLAMLTGVSLGPIADLGQPDALITLFGMQINLLPVLMTVVNCVSTAIFTQGYPAKTKMQLYGMALFFLVFLYDSPSGLVFYWTLNNVFSLVKTVFGKLRNPEKILSVLACIAGLCLLLTGFSHFTGSKRILLTAIGLVLQYPILSRLAKRYGIAAICAEKKECIPNKKLFLVGALFLSALVGMLIPSSVIKASPLEFVSNVSFYHPAWYVLSTSCLAFGSCLIWFGVFYWLASPKGKIFFERVLCVLCVVAIVNYMFFGRNLGILTPSFQYEQGMEFQMMEVLTNAVVIVVVAALVYGICTRWKKVMTDILLISFLAMVGMSVLNISSINSTVETYLNTRNESQDEIQISLSKTGKNVVVLMLDRAAGHMVPYIMNEKPEIAEQFSGFTYYSNVVSYGRNTNFAAPALFGGYEYTPYELNKRETESLCSKHNEALKVMPVMFLEEGYDVTVFDPPYANYQWIPDLSIFDDYPGIKKAITYGSFNAATADSEADENATEATTRDRNLFCFAVVKSAPVCLQEILYEDGNYHHLEETSEFLETERLDFESYPTDSFQVEESLYKARGLYSAFLDAYMVLTHLSDITQITDHDTGSFLMMTNDTTHNGMLLQLPEYVPADAVDNTAYEAANADRFTLNGETLHLEDSLSVQHYHINVAALLQLGKWFDYLRENDVYDNTRIIVVSDHNAGIENMKELMIPLAGQEDLNITGFYPLLMVKDFDSKESFAISTEFMTNADVPTLATQGLLEKTVNPFTGKTIDSSTKTSEKVYLFGGWDWDVTINNGNTFIPSYWYSVQDNIFIQENWSYEGYGVLPE